MDSIKKVIQEALKTSMLYGTGRVSYSPYNMDAALSVVARIRKGIEPSFVSTPKIDELYRNLIRWFHADIEFPGDLGKGFILQGPTGTGKTLAMEVMKIYRMIDDIKFVRDSKLYRMNYEIICSNDLVVKFVSDSFDGIQMYSTRYVLCLDDIGGEEGQAKYFGNNLDVLGYIISERYSKKLLTFGTTNLNMALLEQKYGDRITSRMCALFNFIEVNGCDYRKLRKP